MRKTVVHEHVVHDHSEDRNSMSFLTGLIILLLVVFLFFYYGLPMLRGVNSGAQINVPDKVNVQVQNPQSK